MADYVTLSCPSCGGRLDITADVERFACAHCGNEHVVRRGGGIVSLAPVVAGLNRVQAGVDKTASELAIVRLQQEIAWLQNQFSGTNTSIMFWLMTWQNKTSRPGETGLPLEKEVILALMVKDTPGADPISQGGSRHSDQQLAERFSRVSAEDCDYMVGYLKKK